MIGKRTFNYLSSVFLRVGLICLIFAQPVPVLASQGDQLLFEQALQPSKDGVFVEALSLWNHYLELYPKDAAAWSNRGNVRLALGDAKGAIADQTTSIQLLPDEIDPHLNRGTAEESLELWEEAKKDYQWILQRVPDEPSALYNLANVNGSQGNWNEAETLYKKASFASPGFVMALSSKALAQYQLGQLAEAKSEFRSLIRKYPMVADSRAALTAILWREGSFGEAESNWAAVAGLDSRYRQSEWLLISRRWPPKPTKDLMAFLSLEHS